MSNNARFVSYFYLFIIEVFCLRECLRGGIFGTVMGGGKETPRLNVWLDSTIFVLCRQTKQILNIVCKISLFETMKTRMRQHRVDNKCTTSSDTCSFYSPPPRLSLHYSKLFDIFDVGLNSIVIHYC